MSQEAERIKELERRCQEAEQRAQHLEEAEAREAHLKRLLSAVRNVNQLIVYEDDPERLLERACANLTEGMGYYNAWTMLFDPETPHPAAMAASGLDGAFQALKDRMYRGEIPSCVQQALEQESATILRDPSVECTECPLAAEYEGRAGLCRRLECDGKAYGILAASVPGEYATDPEAHALFEEVSEDLGFALKKIEDAERIRRQQKRLEFVIKGAGAATWEWDIQTGEAVLDRSWTAMLGYDLEELQLTSYSAWAELVHPDDFPAVRAALDACVSGEEAQFFAEYRMRHKEGPWIWVSDRGQVLAYDSESRPTRMFGMRIDVTEQKDAEQALRSSEQRFAELFVKAPLAYQSLDEDGNFIDVNEAWLSTLGYGRDDVIGKWFGHFLAPEFVDAFRNRFPLFKEQGRIRSEFIMVRADGERRWVQFEGRIAHERDGSFKQTHCILQDVTQDRAHEEALKRERDRAQKYLDVAEVMLIAIDSSGKVNLINRKGCEILGYSHEEIIGKEWISNFLPPEIRHEVRQVFNDIVSGNLDGRMNVEGAVLTRDGEQRWINWHNTTLHDEDGSINGTLSSGEDVTDKRRAEEERTNLQAQLNQAQRMESIGRLAGGVAHDFNNMLNVIMGHAEIGIEDVEDGHPLRENLEEIKEAAARSAELTNQLLAFARRQTVAPRIFVLNEKIESILKMLKRLIGEDIDLLWRPADSLSAIQMDPAQIDQILANLVVNARDAIQGVGKITIETGAARFDEAYCAAHAGFLPGDYVMLAVSDDGRGMDATTKEQIFEPFFTTKDPGQGTGLGLSTVYGIVKQNQGFINVYSELGQGTTFRIYLRPEATALAEHLREDSLKTPVPRGRETILLVEDEPALLALGAKMLYRLGYHVLPAADACAAIRLASQHAGEIQLLITDVVMPEMNGRDLAERVSDLYPSIRRLFMSGYTANVIAHQGVLEAGVNFIQKPFSQEELGRKVREVLEVQ